MKLLIVLIIPLLFLAPAYAVASEPRNGTLIMFGSIKGWILFSLFLISRKRNGERNES